MTTTYTVNFRMPVPDFQSEPWHAPIQSLFQSVDNLIYQALIIGGTTPWANATNYLVGNIRIDVTDGSTWLCKVTNLSASVGTTFAQDRTNHPTFWARFASQINPRGAYANLTAYAYYDLVYDATLKIIALCTTPYTSAAGPANLNTEAANWAFLAVFPVATTAASISYDHTASGLVAITAQAAFDEIVVNLNAVNAAKAPIASPAFTGVPAAPTAALNTNTTQLATTGFVQAQLNALVTTTGQIGNVTITYGKIQTMTNSRLLGNLSGGVASPQEITIGSGLVAQSGPTLTAPGFAPAGAFKNLSIKVASTTTINVVADYVTMTDGTVFQTLPINVTINMALNGAVNRLDTSAIAIDTFYAIWAVVKADGTGAGAIASTSYTAPAMPSGYTCKAYIGSVQTIHASATLYGTWQFGRRAQYVVGLAGTANMPLMANANVGTAGYTAIPLARFAPQTAGEIVVTASLPNTNSSIAVAPNNSYGNVASTTNPAPLVLNAAAGSFAATASLLIESTNIYYENSSVGNGVFCNGWVDNI